MIEFRNVSKIYHGGKIAVEDINLSFDNGEFVVFIGTSGSGKTTCMRMINRMIKPSKGEILIDGKNIKDIDEVKLRRKIGYVIQQIGLMPHMTIYENITLVPKLLKWDEKKQRESAENLIKKVDLPLEYLDRYPRELSGGQQQRIGVIRALAADQNIILMDEPFGALDPITRDSLQKLIKRLQRDMGKTVVFVTHDMDEALNMADKIAILDKGRLIQFDTPENILLNPANEFVEEFLGEERINQAKSKTQTVDEIMYTKPIHIKGDKTVGQAIRLMREKRVDTLFVTGDDNVLEGFIDIFDIGRVDRKKTKVKDILREANFIESGTLVREAIFLISECDYKNLPVVDSNNKLIGIFTRANIVDSLYDASSDEDEEDLQEEELVHSTSEIE
ncbi:ABC transporter ATP-binding protein [Miniphocaeibacter halophilus]|uniref:Betaine/proline/choline family ABC transporter ATP-binding protein n=1 Tax=Miniphocaeibacter halophilus TaxID=2931922 RepID=A0AC61MXT6_9FIRM|nr:betaine/proline/choline family ABC transporter ATP-binding protein [Miniphocaeibacter halophilus]QQK08371.1 betaine/proline/choline family ABC transporter ATP-binding protein [Miniphocaeibacter halophilus]